MQYATKQELGAIAMRVLAVEHTLTTLNPEDVKELIGLLKQVKATLKVFMWLGNGVKWIAGLGAAIVAVWYAMKMALK